MSDWVEFTAVKQPSVLVCDYRAEEGLNLQGGDACIVHGDIPISPNRIEQRIGRLDRFGVGRQVRSLTLLPNNCPYHEAWQDSLNQAYEVFSKSIAALQYVIVDEVGRVRKSLGEGIQCILDSTQALQGAEGLLGRELSQIRAQDELDAIEVLVDEEETDLTQRIEDYEDQNDFQGILENWLLSRLHFNRRERYRDGNSGFRWVRGGAPQQMYYNINTSQSSNVGPPLFLFVTLIAGSSVVFKIIPDKTSLRLHSHGHEFRP